MGEQSNQAPASATTDATNRPAQAFAMLRPGATATIIGMIALGTNIELPGEDFLAEKRIQGSNMGSNQFRTDAPRFVDFYFDGRLDLDSLITDRMPLERIGDAMAALGSGSVARTVITYDETTGSSTALSAVIAATSLSWLVVQICGQVAQS